MSTIKTMAAACLIAVLAGGVSTSALACVSGNCGSAKITENNKGRIAEQYGFVSHAKAKEEDADKFKVGNFISVNQGTHGTAYVAGAGGSMAFSAPMCGNRNWNCGS